MTSFRDLAHAEEFAARVHDAIYEWDPVCPVSEADRLAADRRRVDRDLAGLRACQDPRGGGVALRHQGDARRYAEGLVETGALYGEKL